MKQFAELLDRLSYEPSRNNKLRLMTDYFRATPDSERGWALAALTGALAFAHAKPGMIRALIAESAGQHSGLDPLAKLVLRAAREAYAGPGVAEPTFEALRAHLDHERLVDLVLVIGFYCAVVRVLSSLDIRVEPEYQPYLDKYPLPA